MIFDLDDKERKKIISLFNQHEKNIDYLLYLQGFIWQKPAFLKDVVKGDDRFQKRDYCSMH